MTGDTVHKLEKKTSKESSRNTKNTQIISKKKETSSKLNRKDTVCEHIRHEKEHDSGPHDFSVDHAHIQRRTVFNCNYHRAFCQKKNKTKLLWVQSAAKMTVVDVIMLTESYCWWTKSCTTWDDFIPYK